MHKNCIDKTIERNEVSQILRKINMSTDNKNTMTAQEFRSGIKPHPKPKRTKKKNKYGAETKKYQNRRYDSKGEADYAKRLDWQKKFGEIKEIIPQFKIEIKINGVFITNYYVDFKIIYQNGKIEFHEYKGFATELWKLKWRLAKAMYPDYKFILIKHQKYVSKKNKKY